MKRYSIRKRALFPKCVRHFKELRGISVAGCVAKYGSLDDDEAHAHCVKGFQNIGWICLRRKSQLREKFTLLHEIAHLIANKSESTPHHGKKWRDAVVAIGGTYGSYLSYNKRREYLDFSPKHKNK